MDYMLLGPYAMLSYYTYELTTASYEYWHLHWSIQTNQLANLPSPSLTWWYKRSVVKRVYEVRLLQCKRFSKLHIAAKVAILEVSTMVECLRMAGNALPT